MAYDGGIGDAEAHAADCGRRFADGTGHGAVELRLGHKWSFLDWGKIRGSASGGLEFGWQAAMMEG